MQETEIREILGRHVLTMNDIEKALSLTLLDVYLATLDSCIGENVGISSEGLIVIRESIQAKCRMVEVISIDLENGQVLIPGRTPEAFLEIYTQFVRTTQFLRDNFNNLIFKLFS